MRRALITGISGQDGSYLSELLLKKGYQVHGFVRRTTIENPRHCFNRLPNDLIRNLTLHIGSLESYPSVQKCVRMAQPDEIYHLAACSFVSYSMEEELSTLHLNLTGTHHMLSAASQWAPQCRFYFAGSSEMFGSATECPQDEKTPFQPRSVYGISKLSGYHLVRNYRANHGLHACTGILFNHESPRRGFEFVTRKITNGVARIKMGLDKHLELGNLDAERDWGHSRDYVAAMWLMLQQENPRDYVVATGVPHSVRSFCKLAFAHADLDYKDHVVTNETFFRASESTPLIGNPKLAEIELGWKAETSFENMISEMVEADLDELRLLKEGLQE